MEIKSSEVRNFCFLREEIRSVCNFDGGVNDDFVKEKGWVYATLDNKQLLGDDAVNLASALELLKIDYMLGAWVFDLQEGGDIDVEKILSDVKSIEKMQRPECRIDHLDSILFSDFPLRFLIIRPATYQDLLYLVGPIDFVKKAANSFGWKIVTP